MDYLIEKIYNTYLKVSRSQNNKPFRYRKDFSSFEKEKNYLPVLRLKSFFSRHPNIKIEDFFIAPYIVFNQEKNSFYELEFYNTQQAVKVYSLYNKKCMIEDPDSDVQLEKIKEGLFFIRDFCEKNTLKLSDYLNFKTEKTHDFLIHLTQKNISIYNLFAFRDFSKVIGAYDFELLSFILGDLAARVSYFRTKYSASRLAKKLNTEGLKKIEKILSKAAV